MKIVKLFLFVVFSLSWSGCRHLEKIAVKASQGIIDAQFQSFLEEEDSVLAKEAIASNIKLLDGMILKDFKNKKLRVKSARSFFSYSFGYVEDLNIKRASKLYMRGVNQAMELIGGKGIFTNMPLPDFKEYCKKQMTKNHELLFWGCLNYASWVNLNKSSLNALNHKEKIKITALELIEFDEHYYYGGAHVLMAIYYASIPQTLGGKPMLAKKHFERALEISQSQILAYLFFYAKYYAVSVQDQSLFDDLVNQILKFDLNSLKEERLANTIIQNKARELYKMKEDLFI